MLLVVASAFVGIAAIQTAHKLMNKSKSAGCGCSEKEGEKSE